MLVLILFLLILFSNICCASEMNIAKAKARNDSCAEI